MSAVVADPSITRQKLVLATAAKIRLSTSFKSLYYHSMSPQAVSKPSEFRSAEEEIEFWKNL
jgi:hypothetical protein